MAKTLKEMPQGVGRKRNSQWDNYADGQIWQLEVGEGHEDLQSVTIDGARTTAHSYAKSRGLKVSITKISDTEIAVQFSREDGKAIIAPTTATKAAAKKPTKRKAA